MRERAVTFGSHGGLVGVLCEGEGARRDGPAMLMFNIGLNHRPGPGRVQVELARELARLGFVSLRFDLAGLGDSEPRKDAKGSDVERAAQDLAEAMDFVQRRTGIDRFVLLSLCSGTDGAHAVAVQDPRVHGAIFIDGYAYVTAGYHLQRALTRARRALVPSRWRRFVERRLLRRRERNLETRAPEPVFDRVYPPRERFRRDLDGLVARRVNLFFLFTAEAHAYNHRDQFPWMVGWRALPPAVTVELWSDADHVFSTLRRRRALVARLCAWMDATFAGQSSEGRPAGPARAGPSEGQARGAGERA